MWVRHSHRWINALKACLVRVKTKRIENGRGKMWGNCVWLGEERGEGGGGIGRAGELSTWVHQNVISPNYRENIREIVSLTLANDNSFSIHYYNYLLQHLCPLFFQPPKCNLLLSFLNHMVCLFVIKKKKRKEIFV